MTMLKFAVLGTVEVRDGDRPVSLGGPRGQAIVAALLVEANRIVSVDQLVAAAWGDRPPDTARVQAQNRISRLRGVLRARGCESVIITEGSGYVLRAGEDQLDAQRFRRLVAEAEALAVEGAAAAAVDLLAAALRLWRGPALHGLDTPLLLAAARGLEEARTQALERRIALELTLGRHAGLLPELTSLTQVHPYRERLYGFLMLAQYRAGRQAEALETFRHAHGVLTEQLGVVPGADLRRLHEAILRGEDAGPDAGPGIGLGTAVRPAAGPVRVGSVPVPRQLPADVSAFTGREREIAALDALVAGGPETGWDGAATAVVISAIAGTAGVGKTALAVRWAHLVADRYPDGQLYVNLRGYDTDQPLTAGDALAGFLDALGLPDRDLPASTADRAARFRTMTAHRRMLIILDNASSADQVRPLLPGTRGCAVVVTSRDSLAGLIARDGAHRLDLDVLPDADARSLLRRLIGARAASEPEAVARLAEQCARLPLALRIAAELAVARPAVTLVRLCEELADRQRRLDLLAVDGDLQAAVRAGPDFDRYATAALTGGDLGGAGTALDMLTRAHLVQSVDAVRYGMHNLLRAYAIDLAGTDGPDRCRAAVNRLLDYYLAAAAVDLLHPPERRSRPDPLRSAA